MEPDPEKARVARWVLGSQGTMADTMAMTGPADLAVIDSLSLTMDELNHAFKHAINQLRENGRLVVRVSAERERRNTFLQRLWHPFSRLMARETAGPLPVEIEKRMSHAGLELISHDGKAGAISWMTAKKR
jgi:hypothetical protein